MEAGAGRGIAMIFPNVELRLSVATARGVGVNLHLMCAPEHVDELDRILSKLEHTTPQRDYSLTPADLVALGRFHAGDGALDEDAALKVGIRQFKVEFAQLQRVFAKDDWAKEHCLVGFAGAQGDGTSGVRTDDGQFESTRQSMERFANVMFTANPAQREFWLGKSDKIDRATLEQRYGSRKLCLHGCDAHELAKVAKPDLDRFCWLRGDPVFSTLKQACIEPEYRSHIGENAPGSDSGPRRIQALHVTSDGWFSPDEVPVNPGLVAIIGPRGSGKTALADLIAAGAGLAEPFSSKASFVYRAGDLLHDTVTTVEWSDGETMTQSLSAAPGEDLFGLGPPVRYLSQQFVEHLCADDGVSSRLRSEIERVVFNAIPPDRRLGATTFAELVARRLQGPKEQEGVHLDAVAELSSEITTLSAREASRDRLVGAKAATERQLLELATAIQNQTKKVDPALAGRYGAVTAALQERERQAQLVRKRRNGIEALQRSVAEQHATAFPRYPDQLRQRNPDVVLSDEQWAAFALQYTGDVDAILAGEDAAAAAELAAIVGEGTPPPDEGTLDGADEAQLAAETLTRLRAEQERLGTLVGLDKHQMGVLKTLQDRDAALRLKLAETNEQIAAADQAKIDLEVRKEERLGHYRSYFDALLEEETILNELYEPLESILARGGKSLAKLKFSVQRHVDAAAWAAAGESLIDLRESGSFRGRGAILDLVKAELVDAWRTGDGAAAADALRKFSAEHSQELRNRAPVVRTDTDAYRLWQERMHQWMYQASHVTLRYTIEYEGIDINRLSPGTRGVVLLLLYLAVDQNETVPLIIDQPEENLDPESVYNDLVGLFREASTRRQVIMVTHNANLVVNTDADQVIVANCGHLQAGRLPELSYSAGGLEDEATRESVCQILEGGEDAFRERARRLRVDWR
jgi:ABC-type lipoprotein export system ATPase subunit